MTGVDISQATRAKVYRRDSWEGAPCCIYCGRPYPELHHFVERSRGGLGIEENLVSLCHECHTKLHSGEDPHIKVYAQAYLQDKYPGWDEGLCIVRKGKHAK